jgi:hypothetical protein
MTELLLSGRLLMAESSLSVNSILANLNVRSWQEQSLTFKAGGLSHKGISRMPILGMIQVP